MKKSEETKVLRDQITATIQLIKNAENLRKISRFTSGLWLAENDTELRAQKTVPEVSE